MHQWEDKYRDARGCEAYRVASQATVAGGAVLSVDARHAHRLATPLTLPQVSNLQWADGVGARWILAELRKLLKQSSAKNASPGRSGITPRLLRDAPTFVLVAIVEIFVGMRLRGVIPPTLGLGLLCPLRKDPNIRSLPDARLATLLETPKKDILVH